VGARWRPIDTHVDHTENAHLEEMPSEVDFENVIGTQVPICCSVRFYVCSGDKA
jgi:hypothetical protein